VEEGKDAGSTAYSENLKVKDGKKKGKFQTQEGKDLEFDKSHTNV